MSVCGLRAMCDVQLTWKMVAVTITMCITIFVSGKAMAFKIGPLDTLIKTFLYLGHERIWSKITWGVYCSLLSTYCDARSRGVCTALCSLLTVMLRQACHACHAVLAVCLRWLVCCCRTTLAGLLLPYNAGKCL